MVGTHLPEGAVAAELRAPRGRLEPPRVSRIERLWPWLAGGFALLALLFAVVLWRKHAAKRVRVTAYDKAMARLARLEARGLPAADEADAWYVELSDIVRRYLEDRYGVRAPELTTQEFLPRYLRF